MPKHSRPLEKRHIRLLCLLSDGYTITRAPGYHFEVALKDTGGKVVDYFGVATIKGLERRGYVVMARQHGRQCWRITDAGMRLAKEQKP